MAAVDVIAGSEIGETARHPQDSMMGTRRQRQPLDRPFGQRLLGLAQPGNAAQQLGRQAGVDQSLAL